MEDPYLWLEEVESERALQWVESRNKVAVDELTQSPNYTEIYDGLIEIYDSSDKIPGVSKYGDYYYNFWQDADHVRGIWRRCPPESYATPQPSWETVLDIDALGASEAISWVWKGASVLDLTNDRALLRLSDGGKDAVVVREFSLIQKQFVADGFYVPESKNNTQWIDADTLMLGTAANPDEATDSGYPLIAQRWARGTAIQDAVQLYTGEKSDVSISAGVSDSASGRKQFIQRSRTFFERDYFLIGKEGDLTPIAVPEKASIGFFHDQLLVELKDDWVLSSVVLPSGSLVAINFEAFMAGSREFTQLFSPEPRVSMAGFTTTRNHVVITSLDNVNGRVTAWRFDEGNWQIVTIDTPAIGNVSVSAVDSDHSDEIFLTTTSFLDPTALHWQTVGKADRVALKQTRPYFDASGLVMSQHEAIAPDGTRIPYFQVAPKGLKLDGTNPTLLYGYGGFQVSMTPSYSGTWGRSWTARGGVFILANIRGGGEFGPSWHQAALKGNRQVSWNDFIAIGEDLVARKVTSPPHLGIMGGSQGGLLMGVMYTQRPDLWGAVVCQVPLLDMLRFNKLLAGASWMGEYGNPDLPAERAFIAAYSPYQNISRTQTQPRILFVTSTHDDRVHPGHARKMAARLEEYGHDFLYWENTEGGHGGAANNAERAQLHALGYAFLWEQLTAQP
jgi:prolyl oligopeptidase